MNVSNYQLNFPTGKTSSLSNFQQQMLLLLFHVSISIKLPQNYWKSAMKIETFESQSSFLFPQLPHFQLQ